MDLSKIPPIALLAVTAGALWLAHKYGSPEVKGMALGAAGAIIVNQIPVIREGASVRVLTA